MRAIDEETMKMLVERTRAATVGMNSQQSHQKAMQKNTAWLEEKETAGISYAELARRHGVSKEWARVRCLKAMKERDNHDPAD